MIGILYVLHGSKKKGKREQMEDFLFELSKQVTLAFGIPPEQQELAFLEHDPRTIVQGLDNLSAKGADLILVQPILLFPASHALEDIPTSISKFKQMNSTSEVRLCHTFGRNREIIEIALKNAYQMAETLQYSQYQTAFIIHGSKRFDEPLQEMQLLAQQLSPNIEVTVIYGHVTWQSFIEKHLHEPIILVPIFLFEGHLLDRIRAEIASLSANICMTPTLELDKNLIPAILRELRLALEENI